MQTKLIQSARRIAGSAAGQHLGAKAFYLEPFLILGSSLLWLAVLPFAWLFYFAAVLFPKTVQGDRTDPKVKLSAYQKCASDAGVPSKFAHSGV